MSFYFVSCCIACCIRWEFSSRLRRNSPFQLGHPLVVARQPLRQKLCVRDNAKARSDCDLEILILRARTSMAQTRAFAIIGPSLWNQLLPSTRSTLLTGVPSASFRSLKTAFFSLG